MIIIFVLVAVISVGLLRESFHAGLRWHAEELRSPTDGEGASHKRRCDAYAWDALILASMFGISLFVLLLILIRGVAT